MGMTRGPEATPFGRATPWVGRTAPAAPGIEPGSPILSALGGLELYCHAWVRGDCVTGTGEGRRAVAGSLYLGPTFIGSVYHGKTGASGARGGRASSPVSGSQTCRRMAWSCLDAGSGNRTLLPVPVVSEVAVGDRYH